ncbi:MAG: ADP-forming succinate--CoA ligase subunit beta [Anaerolineales bacterium]|nr:ADP-forming succinate--CoA ligase subunit beta [Anaerolineales bacterium]
MKLHEYQSKRLFAQHGVPIPRGEVADTPGGARLVAEALGMPVVVKAQVLTGGRGKAGGIRLVHSLEGIAPVAADILGSHIRGLPVRRVLIDAAAEIGQELYLSVVVDRVAGQPILMASAAGGIDIEDVAAATPEAILCVSVDPLLGLQGYQALAVAKGLGLPAALWQAFGQVARGLVHTFHEVDAQLAEINPLAVTSGGELLALDGKLVLDDNALFRHPDLAAMRDVDAETAAERAAREAGMSYVQLEGDIGCLVNGAGLAMATMDVIKHCGGAPANFLDIGGGARADSVATALRLVLSASAQRAVLINIFGGITRCDEVARGLITALEELRPVIPIVVRLVGTNEAEGRALLRSSAVSLTTAATLSEAASIAVAAARSMTVG